MTHFSGRGPVIGIATVPLSCLCFVIGCHGMVGACTTRRASYSGGVYIELLYFTWILLSVGAIGLLVMVIALL